MPSTNGDPFHSQGNSSPVTSYGHKLQARIRDTSRPSTSGFAVAALITAFLVPLIVPIVLGHMGVREIRSSHGEKSGEWMAVTGMVIGYISLAITIVVIVAGVRIFHALGT